MKHPPSVQATNTPFKTINVVLNAGPVSVVMLGVASDDTFGLSLAVVSADLYLSGHESPITSQVRPLLSSGDAQYIIIICYRENTCTSTAPLCMIQIDHLHRKLVLVVQVFQQSYAPYYAA